MTVVLSLGSYDGITDYTGLVQKAKLWLDRGDDLDPYIPTFIQLCEAYLNRTLRTPEMEAVAQVTTVDGVASLPSDFLQMRRVSANGRTLRSTSPAILEDQYGTWIGNADSYAISGAALRVAPQDDSPITLEYYARIPALGDNAPNWLIGKHPDIYLFGTLVQAEAYVDNPDRVAQWEAAFTATVGQLVDAGRKARWGGPLTMRNTVAQVERVRG